MKRTRNLLFSSALLIAFAAVGLSNCTAQTSTAKKIKFVGISGAKIGVNVNNQLKIYKRDEAGIWSDSKPRFTIPTTTEEVFAFTSDGQWVVDLYLATYENGYVTTWEGDDKGKWHIKPGQGNMFELLDGYDRVQYNGYEICGIKNQYIEFYSTEGVAHPKYSFTAPSEYTELFMIGYHAAVVNKSEMTFYKVDPNEEKWVSVPNLHFTLPDDCKGILPFNDGSFFGVIKDKTIDIYYLFSENSKFELFSTFTIPK